MKIYFEKTNGNNVLIITDERTAKIFDASPTGYIDGIDLYTEDAPQQLKSLYKTLAKENRLCDYQDFTGDIIEYSEQLKEELENAILLFEN